MTKDSSQDKVRLEDSLYTEALALMKFIRIKAIWSKLMAGSHLSLLDRLMEGHEGLAMHLELVDFVLVNINSVKQ